MSSVQIVNMYITDLSEHRVPDDVYQEAVNLNRRIPGADRPDYKLWDYRTKGAKFLEQWAQEQDKRPLEAEGVQSGS